MDCLLLERINQFIAKGIKRDKNEANKKSLPSIRKLCTPQNECTPIDWMFASFIRKISNFVNGIKTGLIVIAFFEPAIIKTSTLGSSIFTGIECNPPFVHIVCKRSLLSAPHTHSSGHVARPYESCKNDSNTYHFISMLKTIKIESEKKTKKIAEQ